jgi:acetate---CoA ligase (ADP-forming)
MREDASMGVANHTVDDRTERLHRALAPRAVAVLGASPRLGSLSLRFLNGLARHGFDGPVVAVNPNYDEVGGFRCVPTVGDAGPIDLAVIAVAKARVMAALEGCAEAGVAGALVFSSGYSETGEAGREEEREITALARRTGLRVIGPNSVGLINMTRSACAIASSVSYRDHFVAGRVGVVSQSGGVGGLITERAQDAHVGLSCVIATGNEADVGMGEALRFLAADEATAVVAMFVEGIRDPQDFVAGLAALRAAGKPAVVLKTGATEVAARASAAHTGSLMTDADVFRAVLERHGAIPVDSLDDLIETAAALDRIGPAGSARVGIITTSGGAGVVATEAAERAGLGLPPLPASAQAALRAVLPDFASPSNPTDMSGMFTEKEEIFRSALRAFLEGDFADAVVLVLTAQPPDFSLVLADRMLEVSAMNEGAPLVCLWIAGRMVDPAIDRLRSGGMMVFDDPDRLMRVLRSRAEAGQPLPAASAVPVVAVPAWLDDARAAGSALESEALAALGSVGVPVAETVLCSTVEEARAAATAIGGPVVVKAAARDLLHKAAVGAVVVGVEGPDAVAAAWEQVTAAARAAGAFVEGAVVQRLAARGTELIVGVRRDPLFGPALVFGEGGTGVEERARVTRRMLPLGDGEAEALTAGHGHGAAVVAAIRGVEALALALGDELEAVEVNPLIVAADGTATAVDAVILFDSTTEGRSRWTS